MINEIKNNTPTLAKKIVATGIQNFETLITSNCFYIDKTYFIKEWWEGRDEITLITRPRRFGKTLTMSMVECFFSNKYQNREELFQTLSIWKDTKYHNLQGTYPVINFTFSEVKTDSYELACYQICKILTKLYEKNRFLQQSGVLSNTENLRYERMCSGIEEKDAPTALQELSDFLSRYYKKKVIILLDEYDTPMQEAYTYGYWGKMTQFMRSLFGATFKSNPYLERAIMTGVTRISKESIFSDLNNLEVVTTTSDKYATVFGFTEKEVFEALDNYELSKEKETVKFWYNGFTFGEHTNIYNPWSILHLLQKKKYANYWVNTSSNTLIKTLLQKGDKKTKIAFEHLLKGETIKQLIDEQMVFNQLDNNKSAIWSLLLASGYLKVVSCEKATTIGGKLMCELAITNKETMDMFYGIVLEWFTDCEEYNEFVKELLHNNVKGMNKFINKIALQMFSSFDTGTKPSTTEPERFYHGFVLGLLVDLREEYIITSNRESGYGRYDVMIEPLDKSKNAYILEFKVLDPDEESTLEDTVQSALHQIEEKKYKTSLLARGYTSIYCYGFAFRGKEVLIG